jgi:hypothetical protein
MICLQYDMFALTKTMFPTKTSVSPEQRMYLAW